MARLSAVLALSLLAAGAPVHGQSPGNERTAVIAAVNDLLDSWREADNSKSERVLHDDFRLTTFQGEGANRRIHVVDRAGLIKASKDLKAGEWDDRLREIDVRIGSNGLAILTAKYLFYAGGKPTHCGLVAMQLYKQAGEWKIISFADTHNNLKGRTEAEVCPS